MTIEQLKKIIADGQFHHATYRTDFARGLHVYAKEGYSGKLAFRGFEYVGMFSQNDPECEEAYKLTRNSGIYEGSYK